jgi:SAM-dependent methyltransferase
MAGAYSGCEVLQQNFLQLDLPDAHFDGVLANAVLFHVPSQALPRVLKQLHTTLKPGGVLFSSNPHGNGDEGWSGDRYGAFHDLQTWTNYMLVAGLIELTHYYRPAGLPIELQPWLASVWRRPIA